MKGLRYIVFALFALSAMEAAAWTTEVNRAVLMFAEENLTRGAKRKVNELLGAPLSSVEFEKKGKNRSRLNKQGQSVATSEHDGVVQLEEAIATLKDRDASPAERKAALLATVELTVDIHCLANVVIDGALEKNFTFSRHNAMQEGFRFYAVKKMSWRNVWHSYFHGSHGRFSAEMYLYDWSIATKGMAKGYKKESVAPRKWVEKTGERALQALKVIEPDALIDNVEIAKLEEINNSAMYDAAFHLAHLLNTIF